MIRHVVAAIDNEEREVPMSVRVIAVQMSSGGTLHSHIEDLRWIEDGTGDTGDSSRAQMVEWVERGGFAYTFDDSGDKPRLFVRTSAEGTKYVQTQADGIWQDNLLALPRF